MASVALIIIYNHQFLRNVELIETIYKDRFSHIYHLMPFYQGDKENVIPVYENSRYFQGYVTQGIRSFSRAEYRHYIFAADDLMLNPKINEDNYAEHFALEADGCFLPLFTPLHKVTFRWPRVREAYEWRLNTYGVEAKNQLPDAASAQAQFALHNFSVAPLRFEQIYEKPKSINKWLDTFFHDQAGFRRLIKNWLNPNKTYTLPYPLIGGYADLFVVSAACLPLFAHYCGVFTATELFVEVAIPTAMLLAASQISTENKCRLKGKALWTAEDFKVLEPFHQSFDALQRHFPERFLYLHPIKLSAWMRSAASG